MSVDKDVERHSQVFSSMASVERDGAKFLTRADFVKAIAPRIDFYNIAPAKYGVLFDVADSSKKGLLSLADYLAFQATLSRPDAEFEILYRLLGGRESLKASQLKKFWASQGSETSAHHFGTDTLKLYLGASEEGTDKTISYPEFAQLLKGLQDERLKAEFQARDLNGTGLISQSDFHDLLIALAGHRLSPAIKPNVDSLFPGSTVSFGSVSAVMNIMHHLESIQKGVQLAAKDSPDSKVSKEALAKAFAASRLFDGCTPLEVDTIFKLVGGEEGIQAAENQGVSLSAFDCLFDPRYGRETLATGPVEPAADPQQRLSAGKEILKGLYNFALGSIAGAIGATFVYPIDLVKTRMQNQRSKVVGQLMYKNSLDCFKKVIKNEGAKGLYSGLLPQLVGVAPEKAIKLTMNDLVRGRLKDPKTGDIKLSGEILAGCIAGGSQVLFTNPLEIVKIRLQVQGELAKAAVEGGVAEPRRSAVQIVRQLGLLGLYKGVGACLLRDIPFSGIYFPTYSHLKKDVFGEGVDGKKLSIAELLISGALAGMPAAYLVTPADVIKTRLQVQARKGETVYNGIMDAAVKIMKEEGPRAFYKGGVARIMRSSPQFGVTLAAYEMLHSLIPIDFGDHEKKQSVTHAPLFPDEVGKRNVMRLIHDLSPDVFKTR